MDLRTKKFVKELENISKGIVRGIHRATNIDFNKDIVSTFKIENSFTLNSLKSKCTEDDIVICVIMRGKTAYTTQVEPFKNYINTRYGQPTNYVEKITTKKLFNELRKTNKLAYLFVVSKDTYKENKGYKILEYTINDFLYDRYKKVTENSTYVKPMGQYANTEVLFCSSIDKSGYNVSKKRRELENTLDSIRKERRQVEKVKYINSDEFKTTVETIRGEIKKKLEKLSIILLTSNIENKSFYNKMSKAEDTLMCLRTVLHQVDTEENNFNASYYTKEDIERRIRVANDKLESANISLILLENEGMTLQNVKSMRT